MSQTELPSEFEYLQAASSHGLLAVLFSVLAIYLLVLWHPKPMALDLFVGDRRHCILGPGIKPVSVTVSGNNLFKVNGVGVTGEELAERLRSTAERRIRAQSSVQLILNPSAAVEDLARALDASQQENLTVSLVPAGQ